MFEPKIYKKNGLEAFRLLGSDGSEFFYEGAIDCDEKILYKDSLGRLYYPVTAEIGGAVKYYVELDPQVQQIPSAGQDSREKAISRLVNASPRPDASLPEDIFIKPEAPQEMPLEVPIEIPVEVSQATPQETLPAEPAPVVMPAEPAAEIPVPAPVEHVKSEEAASAINAVFSPKVDILHPPVKQEEKAVATETKEEQKASRTKAPPKAAGKRSLKWPLAVAAVVIVLLVASAVGVYIVKPGAYDGLRSMFNGSSPTPVPTATPTEAPTPSPTPSPIPPISELIDSDSPAIAAFVQAHVNATSEGNPMRQVCDLFDYVNDQWKYTSTSATSLKAGEITSTLEGTTKDYTALMVSLIRSLGIRAQIVAYTVDGDINPRYYPEVLASNTSSGYQAVREQLDLWYGVSSRYGHSDEIGYWVALSMGSSPGIRPSDATTEYALPGDTIIPPR